MYSLTSYSITPKPCAVTDMEECSIKCLIPTAQCRPSVLYLLAGESACIMGCNMRG